MPQRVVIVEGKPQAFPADATDAEISAALNAIPAANAPHAPKARTWTDLAVDLIPAAGAVAGGVLGNVPGAMLGAAGGEAWKQNINRLRGADAPETAADATVKIGAQAGAQAAGAGIVRGGIAAGSLAAKGLVELSDMVSPEIAGMVSPRLGNILRFVNRVKAAKGVTAAEPSAAVASAPADAASAAPTVTQAAPSASAAVKLSAAEMKAAQEMMKKGASGDKALTAIMAQREFLKRFDLPSPAEVAKAVKDRAATGVWGSQ